MDFKKKFTGVLLAVLLAGCVSQQENTGVSAPDLEGFKTAIIAYIDAHPGFFKGRHDSKGLKEKQIVKLESDEEYLAYSLEEFIIYPDQMRFWAEYNPQGPEAYTYNGKFEKSILGKITVGNIKVAKFIIHLKEDTSKSPIKTSPP